MIPGMSNMPGIENVKVDPKDVARKRAMVLSMTLQNVKILIY